MHDNLYYTKDCKSSQFDSQFDEKQSTGNMSTFKSADQFESLRNITNSDEDLIDYVFLRTQKFSTMLDSATQHNESSIEQVSVRNSYPEYQGCTLDLSEFLYENHSESQTPLNSYYLEPKSCSDDTIVQFPSIEPRPVHSATHSLASSFSRILFASTFSHDVLNNFAYSKKDFKEGTHCSTKDRDINPQLIQTLNSTPTNRLDLKSLDTAEHSELQIESNSTSCNCKPCTLF